MYDNLYQMLQCADRPLLLHSLRYPFGKDRTEHSGQYQRPIQKTHFFYNELPDRMDVGVNPLIDAQVGDTSP